MCENIEIDITEESLEHMKIIARDKILPVVHDKCSMTLLDECEENDYDALALAVGKTIMNSVIVDLIVDGIKIAEDLESEKEIEDDE